MKKLLTILALAGLCSGAALAGPATAPAAAPALAMTTNPFGARSPAAPAPVTAPAPGQPYGLAVPNLDSMDTPKAFQETFERQGIKLLQTTMKVVGLGQDFAMLRMLDPSGAPTQSLLVREGESVVLGDGKPYSVKLTGRSLNERRVQFYFKNTLVFESDVAAPTPRKALPGQVTPAPVLVPAR
ncbi:hypothetical protein [Ramlibacter alkalitolerans]|uniref:Uncharacterized protein n=1 Tax=Ramlibacter alkalitolerans TaxID=2039631 RepID=A0ABS1JU57_9BURK|nr:hypothetical protein [Ramlibacter alkalitolerans]MBL0427752.1 hypothetical protein [Ramlibacter alkalitolerans]